MGGKGKGKGRENPVPEGGVAESGGARDKTSLARSTRGAQKRARRQTKLESNKNPISTAFLSRSRVKCTLFSKAARVHARVLSPSRSLGLPRAISAVAPVVKAPNQLLGAPLGTDVQLECFVEAFPNTINYWVKNQREGSAEDEMLLEG